MWYNRAWQKRAVDMTEQKKAKTTKLQRANLIIAMNIMGELMRFHRQHKSNVQLSLSLIHFNPDLASRLHLDLKKEGKKKSADNTQWWGEDDLQYSNVYVVFEYVMVLIKAGVFEPVFADQAFPFQHGDKSNGEIPPFRTYKDFNPVFALHPELEDLLNPIELLGFQRTTIQRKRAIARWLPLYRRECKKRGVDPPPARSTLRTQEEKERDDAIWDLLAKALLEECDEIPPEVIAENREYHHKAAITHRFAYKFADLMNLCAFNTFDPYGCLLPDLGPEAHPVQKAKEVCQFLDRKYKAFTSTAPKAAPEALFLDNTVTNDARVKDVLHTFDSLCVEMALKSGELMRALHSSIEAAAIENTSASKFRVDMRAASLSAKRNANMKAFGK